MKNTLLFDEFYYSHDCGRPYLRDEVWLNFFDQIAKRIIEQVEPKTVLDAGCAWGFLVEAFRKYGVESFGVDISEYAIQNIHPDIKPYCWIGSITEPFPGKYDLITCIEVLEHIPQREAEKAVGNLCSHANEIIFSSTPFDYKETTHVNVHDPEYWAEQFAQHGFYRDMEADMSYITSWAVRFVKTKRTSARLVQEYERKIWKLLKENIDLRHLSIETQDLLRQQDKQVHELGIQVAEMKQASVMMAQVAEITSSKGWKIALFFRRIRVLLVPPNSHRSRALSQFIRIFFPNFRSEEIKNKR
jgi:SAM-dependent methyltransferase